MSESGNLMSATFMLILMVGLWIVLLITMSAGINIPSPLASSEGRHGAALVSERVAKTPVNAGSAAAEEEIAADEYQVMEQMLMDYPRMTTLFEAAMVDGKITYQEAENLLAQKDAIEKEQASGAQESARDRLMKTIEKMRNQ